MKLKLYITHVPVLDNYFQEKIVDFNFIHPSKQLEELFKLLDKKEDISIVSSNDIFIQHINNLVARSLLSSKKEKSIYLDYEIPLESISVFEINENLEKTEILWRSEEDLYGFCSDWITDSIIQLNSETSFNFGCRY